jgi:hypothetical protein
MYNNQTAFYRVWSTFVVNKAPRSITPITTDTDGAKDNRCSYGDPATTGCAIACLMPTPVRVSLWEHEQANNSSLCVTSAMREFSPMRELLIDCDQLFLEALQSCHDRVNIDAHSEMSFDALMRERLTALAREYRLTMPVQEVV